MNDPIYRLSNRQKKELLIRDRMIVVAIPATWEACEMDERPTVDLRDWAAARIEGIERSQIVSALLLDVVVEPKRGGDGLTAILGMITDPAPGRLQIVVSVVAVTLCATARPRHAPTPLAWPGSARCGDMIWPREPNATGGQ